MRIVCVGLATRDTIWRVSTPLAADGRAVATDLVVAGGGPAATAAVTVARLGVEAAFAGAVGDDEAGNFVRDGLIREGVDVSRMTIRPGARTAQSTVIVGPTGERSIVHDPGDARIAPGKVDADWVHVDHAGYGTVGGRLSVDGGNPIPGLSLEGVELYAPTEERLRQDFGTAKGALAAGAELVVVTRGAAGSVATKADGTVVETPGMACEPVSTLGAGDVFHGALVAFLAQGAALQEALVAANTAAALSCRALDGRSAIPTIEELEEYLR